MPKTKINTNKRRKKNYHRHAIMAILFFFVCVFSSLSSYLIVNAAAVGYVWTEDEKEFISYVNSHRSNKGLGTMSRSDCITNAARAWSKTMANNNRLYHSSSGYLAKYCPGSGYGSSGENIFYTTATYSDNAAYDAFAGFINSPPHKANMETAGWDYNGAGFYYDKSNAKLWVTHIMINCYSSCPGQITAKPSDNVAADNSKCYNIVGPSSVKASEKFTATVNFDNIGGYRWPADVYKIGSKSPDNNTTWGKSSVVLGSGGNSYLKPGWRGWFETKFTAPSTSGTYNFKWQVKKPNGGFFGDICNKTITVTGGLSSPPDSSETSNTASSGTSPSTNSTSNSTMASDGTGQTNGQSEAEPNSVNQPRRDVVNDRENVVFSPDDIDQPGPGIINSVNSASPPSIGESTISKLSDKPYKIAFVGFLSLAALASGAYGLAHTRWFIQKHPKIPNIHFLPRR